MVLGPPMVLLLLSSVAQLSAAVFILIFAEELANWLLKIAHLVLCLTTQGEVTCRSISTSPGTALHPLLQQDRVKLATS